MAVSALDRVTAIATALARQEGRAGDNEMVREAAEAAGRAASPGALSADRVRAVPARC